MRKKIMYLEKIDLSIKMRLIGYYMSDDQFMRSEAVFPKEAEALAELFKESFNSLTTNRYIDEEMRTVLAGNTVFILKGENGHLYGYYPKFNIARITQVCYVKNAVTPINPKYKRWFVPGDRIRLYRDLEPSSEPVDKDTSD